jgi:POT family proton-dependent oligopeptide transporter
MERKIDPRPTQDQAPGRDQAAGSWHGLDGHPKGLGVLFFAELWERFSYYGMRALLVLFMVTPTAEGGLGFTAAEAAVIYGNYTMAVFMLAIPGGFAADAFLGARGAVLIGGLIIAAGHFSLAVPSTPTFYLGLVLLSVGTGLFKPCISAMVGSLYTERDPRRDAGFSLFYMGVNIGAFFSPLVTGFLAQSPVMKGWLVAIGLDPSMSWHWGFGAAGIGMVVGLAILMRGLPEWRGERDPEAFGHVWPWSPGVSLAAVVGGSLLLVGLVILSDREGFEALRWAYVGVPAALALWFGLRGDTEGRRYGAMMVLMIASLIFWAIFEQTGVTIALFADQLTRSEVAGLAFPSAWFQSLNSLFVIVLSPFFAGLWMKLGARQPSSPLKFALGLLFLSSSFLLMVPAAMLTAEGRVSPFWLVGLFFLQTVGELMLSPVGLSTMTKIAPARMVGFVMGIWFVGMALGNKLAGVLGSAFTANDPAALAHGFLWQGGMAAAAAVALLVLVPWVKRLMGGVT